MRQLVCWRKGNEQFKAVCREIPSLLTRRFKSSYHADTWKDYESLLMIRSQLSIFSRILFSSIAWAAGSETWNMTEDYLSDKGGPPNAELTRDVLPYAKFIAQASIIARILLFIASFKWRRLIKLHLHFEFLLETINACMPVEINAGRDIQLMSSITIMNVTMSCFDLIPTLISTSLIVIPVHTRRVVFYNDSIGAMVVSGFMTWIWLMSMVVAVHLVVTKVGFTYIEAEALRSGNEQTLDNLDEGVIILSEEDMEIRYYNKAASVSNIKFDPTVQQNDAKPDYTSFAEENLLRRFSPIDKADLKPQKVVDTRAIVRKINDLENYKSLQDIIKQSRDDNFPERKSLFKLKKNLELGQQSSSNG